MFFPFSFSSDRITNNFSVRISTAKWNDWEVYFTSILASLSESCSVGIEFMMKSASTTLSSYIYCQALGQSYTIAAYMDENMNVHRVNPGFMLTLFLNNSDKSNYWHEPKLRPKCNMGCVLMSFKKLRLKQGPLNTILPYIYDYSYISQRLSTHHTPM